MLRPTLLAAILMLLPCLAVAAGPSDPYLWLEDVESEKALAWAKDLGRKTVAELQKVKEYQPVKYTDEGDYYRVHQVLRGDEKFYLRLGDQVTEIERRAQ